MSKRELIDTAGEKCCVRRGDEGGDVGRSPAEDVRRQATTETRLGQGDQGDRKH